MKYLKTFESYKKEESINLSQNDYSSLMVMLKDKLAIIGFGVSDDTIKNQYKRISIKLDFRSVEYSILWFLCKATLNEEIARPGYQVVPLSIKFLDPSSSFDAIINLSNESMISVEDAFKTIITNLINHFDNISDTRVCIGNSSEYQYPIFKKLIVNYLKNLLDHNSTIDDTIFNTIKEYIGNSPKPHAMFNQIKTENPFLFSKLNDDNTSISADIGDLGYND